MILEKFHIILSLFSGLVIIVSGLIFNSNLNTILIVMLITMLAFYIAGMIIKSYIQKIIPKEEASDIDTKEEDIEKIENEIKEALENTDDTI